MAKVIMIQGTMSNAGKTFLCAGLCRILMQEGYRVAPFKSQNMALNSFITREGLEMGRAQVMQAEAAGIEPEVSMNPILLKPTSNMGSQVIVNGKVRGNMAAKEYFAEKKQFIPDIMGAYQRLADKYDIIVIEGAGSPAEINLKKDDIVNMGMAKMVDAPVLLVGDIDRGGVFAQLYGTVALLEPEERERIKGLIINKFRGDKSILEPGLKMMERQCKIPVAGVIPYENVDIDDEDSLAERLSQGTDKITDVIHIKVVKFPRISNFTDCNALSMLDGVSVTYVEKSEELENADIIILPGSKNTISDLLWMRQNGLEAGIKKQKDKGTLIWGICGGYQMLGMTLKDEIQAEDGEVQQCRGMELLPVYTSMQEEKIRTRISGILPLNIEGAYRTLAGAAFEGYEIHMGCTKDETLDNEDSESVLFSWNDHVFGTYVHGIFDSEEIRLAVYNMIADKKGIARYGAEMISMKSYKEQQYDILADNVRKNIDMELIHRILGLDGEKEKPAEMEIFDLEKVRPEEIEKRSFEIITEELAGRRFPLEQELIVKRVIHTSADFEYADTLYFSEDAVKKGIQALKNGAYIVSDTTMVQSGIHKKTLHRLGGEAICYIGDEEVATEAKKRGITRSAVSMEKAAKLDKPVIFAIGNAPTALVQLHQMIEEGRIKPELVIGVPVGFVNVVQSKKLIMKTDVPVIVAKGRKGGSNIAAAICNALLYMIDNDRD